MLQRFLDLDLNIILTNQLEYSNAFLAFSSFFSLFLLAFAMETRVYAWLTDFNSLSLSVFRKKKLLNSMSEINSMAISYKSHQSHFP